MTNQKKQQQGSLFSTATANAAATTPTTANSETALTTTNAATPATTLAQRVIKIQFHLQNIGNSIIIIGQELIECKKEVGHGNWTNWLKENFKLKKSTAANFMAIAERFSNFQTSGNFSQSQLVEMLALPAGEEEKFIEQKAAEGNPVENMTIKQEREEIKKYKAKIEQLDKDNQKLTDINHNLRRNLDASSREMLDIEEQNQKLQDENKQLADIAHTLRLENEALKDQEPQIIETVKTITPPDYVATVQRAEKLQESVNSLLAQKEDAQKTIEDLQKQIDGNKTTDPPADFQKKLDLTQKKLEATREKLDATKNELFNAQQAAENAKAELADAQKEAENAKEILSTENQIEQLFQSAAVLINSPYYRTAFKNYMQKNTDTKNKIDGLRSLCDKFNTTCKVVEDIQKKNK